MNFGTDVEPTILINPLSIDEVVVAWMYYGSPSHIEFASSSDNGDNWYRGNIPYTDSLGSADPSLAFTQDGKVHIIHLSDEISIISSDDIFTNNPTWNGPYEVSSSGDKPWLSSDLTSGDCSGNLYSTFSANLIKNKVSDDNGSTWSSIGIFDSVENVYPYWSTSIVNNCGTMFVFWSDYDIPYYIEDTYVQDVRLYFSEKECLQSALSTPATPIYEEFLAPAMWPSPAGGYCLTTGAYPSAAYDHLNDIIYIVTQTITFDELEIPDKNITLLKSDDSGITWDNLNISYLNDSSSNQVLPWITVDENGIVFVVYYEYENSSDDVDIYMIGSYDNGDTFSLGPIQLNDETLQSSLCLGRSEYIGITAKEDHVFISWVHYGELDEENPNGSDIIISHYTDIVPSTPTNLSVSAVNGHPYLQWDENVDVDFSHYNIWVKYATSGNPGFWHFIANTSNSAWIDYNVGIGLPSDRSYYKITSEDYSGKTSDYSNTVYIRGDVNMWPARKSDQLSQIPDQYLLHGNHPNPFNTVTNIDYALPHDSQVTITVYSLTGRQVVTLVDEHKSAGYYQTTWQGMDDSGIPVASGLYFYHLKADGFEQTQKMLSLK